MHVDHLVFAAARLDDGQAWMTERLGVAPGGHGVHPLMGTHNALWSLGDCYLEVIAVDPDAEAQRRRWFGLDDPEVRRTLDLGPRLHHWVARVADMDAARGSTSLPLGPAVRVTRAGLHWDLTVRDDGALVEGGRAPTLIAWPASVRTPERTLPDSGARLTRIEIGAPSDALRGLVGGMERVCLRDAPRFAVTLRRSDGREVEIAQRL